MWSLEMMGIHEENVLLSQPHERLGDSHNCLTDACLNHAILQEVETKATFSTVESIDEESISIVAYHNDHFLLPFSFQRA